MFETTIQINTSVFCAKSVNPKSESLMTYQKLLGSSMILGSPGFPGSPGSDYPLVMTNIAMENGPFTDDLPLFSY